MDESPRIEAALTDTQIEGYLSALHSRFRDERGWLGRLSEASGVSIDTLRVMARPDWKPRSIENLIKVERALDALDAGPEGEAA